MQKLVNQRSSLRSTRPWVARSGVCVIPHISHPTIQLWPAAIRRHATGRNRHPVQQATLHGEQQLMPDPLASDLALTQTSLLAQEIKTLPAQQVAETLWGFTLTHGYDAALFATVAAVASDEMERYDPAALVGILSAQAHVGHTDRAFVVAAADRLAAPYVLAEVDAATLTQAVWVLALLDAQGAVRVAEEESILLAVTAVTKQAGRKMGDFSPDDLTRLLIGLAELGVPPPTSLVEAATARLQSTLIPLAQLSPGNLADCLWAYARLGCYDRGMFDAAQAELQRKASQLDLQSLARVSWACSNVRDRDVKHRAVHDANFLALLAQQAVKLMEDTNSNTAAASTDATGNPPAEASGSDSATANTSVAGSLNPPAPHSSVLTLLLSFANLSHTDTLLFQRSAKFLTPQLGLCSAQELVVLAFVYARMKQSAPLLLDALADAVPQVLSEMDGDDLVYLASVGPATSHYSDALMKVVMDRVLELAAADPRSLSPGQLLDLARCVAAVSHQGPQHYYEEVQKALLKAVNAAHQVADMEDMSTHCGATNPLGLQK